MPLFHLSVSRSLIIYCIYAITLMSLLIYAGFSIPYLYTPPSSQASTQFQYITPNLTATAITCGFPVSRFYGQILQYIYFILLATTFLLRKFPWLCAGIAAYCLNYSDIAALHSIVLFATNNRLAPRTHSCAFLPLGESVFPVCAGVLDPDYHLASAAVGAGLLAALPMARFSLTFRSAAARPIFVVWTLLLAVAHIFYNITVTNPNSHYQICPTGSESNLPEDNYHAPEYDVTWQELFFMMSKGNFTKNECLYSCFADRGYLGRTPKEIGIYALGYPSVAAQWVSITFWIFYIVLTIAMFASKQMIQPAPEVDLHTWAETTQSHTWYVI